MVQTSTLPSLPRNKPHRKQLAILAAASKVFRRQGLHATGMRDIAAETGMHVGNLYYYFRNKQELLAFCQDHTLTGLLELATRIRSLPEPADAKLYRLIVGHVRHLNEAMPGSLAHLEVEALEGRWRERIVRRRNEYETALRGLLVEGVVAGLFREADPKIVAKAILGSINWTVKWFQSRGEKTSEQIGEEFAELLVRGLLAPGTSFQAPA